MARPKYEPAPPETKPLARSSSARSAGRSQPPRAAPPVSLTMLEVLWEYKLHLCATGAPAPGHLPARVTVVAIALKLPVSLRP